MSAPEETEWTPETFEKWVVSYFRLNRRKKSIMKVGGHNFHVRLILYTEGKPEIRESRIKLILMKGYFM